MSTGRPAGGTWTAPRTRPSGGHSPGLAGQRRAVQPQRAPVAAPSSTDQSCSRPGSVSARTAGRASASRCGPAEPVSSDHAGRRYAGRHRVHAAARPRGAARPAGRRRPGAAADRAGPGRRTSGSRAPAAPSMPPRTARYVRSPAGGTPSRSTAPAGSASGAANGAGDAVHDRPAPARRSAPRSARPSARCRPHDQPAHGDLEQRPRRAVGTNRLARAARGPVGCARAPDAPLATAPGGPGPGRS